MRERRLRDGAFASFSPGDPDGTVPTPPGISCKSPKELPLVAVVKATHAIERTIPMQLNAVTIGKPEAITFILGQGGCYGLA